MLKIPDNILVQYEAILTKKGLAVSVHSDYKKWLRYFLDFCGKYPVPASRSERVRLFIEKLREKKQTPDQQKQAGHAISLYFESIRARLEPTPAIVDQTLPVPVNTKTTLRKTIPCCLFFGIFSRRTSEITGMYPGRKDQNIYPWYFPERK
ncbi:MAG: phage integrase N-terminal SAM-like domain-containing protein [bacterium]|nr:phage integrase N-terminal SAM-like domain-containing protein [bacterium]